jgi:hypothetical protein
MSNSLADRFDDTFQIRHHLLVGEAQDLETLFSKEGIAIAIGALSFGKIVGLSVKLDDDLGSKANEVGDIISERDLSANTQTVDSISFDMPPQQSLRARHRLAKLPRSDALAFVDNCVRHSWLPPSLTLPHRGGGNGESISRKVIHRYLRGGATPTPTLPRKRERESEFLLGEIAANRSHELNPPASVGISRGLKP